MKTKSKGAELLAPRLLSCRPAGRLFLLLLVRMYGALVLEAAQHVHAVLERGQHRRKALRRGLGAAGQVDDERAAAQARYPAGEHPPGRYLHAGRAHRLRYAGRDAVYDGLRRLRGHVPAGEARSARRHGQTYVQLVGAVHELALDELELVRHDVAVFHRPAVRLQHFLHGRAARVLTLAPAALVAHGYDRRRILYLFTHALNLSLPRKARISKRL